MARAPNAAALDLAEAALLADEWCRRELVAYARACYPLLTLDPWQVALCARLQAFVLAIERGEGPRLMVHVPPQCGKSTIVARAFVAWIAGRHPEWPGIVVSYAASLATRHGRWIRNHLQSELHQRLFPGSTLAGGNRAVDDFGLAAGGQVLSRGVGGGTTGNPAMFVIIDDPFADRAAADSATVRDAVDDWYTSVVTTRLGPGAGVLVMHTRWHVDDLAGRLLARAKDGGDAWEVVSFPALAADGAALPCRFSAAEFQRKRANLPPRDWLSLYQQTPVAEGGTVFQLKWLHEEPWPEGWKPLVYQAWDLAGTRADAARGGCWSVGVALARDWLRRWWLVDVTRGRWDAGELTERILAFGRQWQAQRIWGEDPVALYLEPFLRERMQQSGIHLPFRRVNVQGRGDKVARAQAAVVPVLANGSFCVPRGATWLPALRSELAEFPAGAFKDQVDALSLGLAEAMDLAAESPPPPTATRAKDGLTWQDLDHPRRPRAPDTEDPWRRPRG